MTETGESATGAGDESSGLTRLPHARPVTLRDLPGEGQGGPWWWERRRSCALDVTLAVLSAAECAAEGVSFARNTAIPVPLGVLLGVLAGGMLLFRRRWPAVVVLVSIAIIPAEMGSLLGMVGFYTLAASDAPRRIIALLAGMQAIGTLLITFIRVQQSNGQEDFDLPIAFVILLATLVAVVFTAPPLLLGLYLGARRRLVESLRERADGLERELSLLADRAEERAEWARREERTRIAREMHDVVAHRVSLMVVHSAALQAVALKDPEKASRNAALVGDMGRQALTELRTMLGVLRSGSDTPEAGARPPTLPAPTEGADRERPLAQVARYAAASADRHQTRPDQPSAAGGPGGGPGGPGLTELEALVEQSRAAGMTVELAAEGDDRRYALPVERTAYRVVQEALTNVHKHAAGAATRVRLARRPEEVAVLVENEAPAEGAPGAGLPSGGNGLLGMRERVTSLGGGFVSGPTERGGFRVSAIIPDRG